MRVSTFRVLLSATTAIMLASTSVVFGGEMKALPEDHFSFKYFGIGGIDLNLDNFNADLARNGVGDFKSYSTTLSLGGQKSFKRLIGEHELSLLMWKREENASTTASLMAGNLLWNAGYNVLPSKWRTDLYPFGGIGVGLTGLNVLADKKSFEDALIQSEPDLFAWQWRFILNAGIGANFAIKNQTDKMGGVVGIRVGYLFDPTSTNRWRSGGTEISGLSALDHSGPYIKVIFGGWGKNHHQKAMECKMSDCTKKDNCPIAKMGCCKGGMNSDMKMKCHSGENRALQGTDANANDKKSEPIPMNETPQSNQ